jgi:TolB-like protein
MTRSVVFFICALVLTACAAQSSTSSILLPAANPAHRVAIVGFDGPLGDQAVDLITQELASRGISVVERARTRELVAVDTDLASGSPAAVEALSSYGEQLNVRYLFVGTVTTDQGPLSSYPHVFMTMRLLDVRSGQTRWIGRYGDPNWTSAWSQQGDLQRGARHIVREFVDAGGPSIFEQ